MNSMPLRPEAADDLSLRLPAHCTTTIAEDLRVRLVLATERDAPMEVDASAVESVGQAVLQLLIAAHAEAARVGQSFSIVDPSDAFVRRVESCGLADAVGLRIEKENLR